MVVAVPLDVSSSGLYGPFMVDRSAGIVEADVTDEAELLQESRAGRPEAYAALYELHHDAVLRLARRLARDEHEADDVVSEVFCNALRAIRNGGGPRDEARAYLLRSVRHTVINLHTRKDTARATPVPDVDLDRPDTHDPFRLSGPATDAFFDVGDRFRGVLWSTEVDGAGTAEVAAERQITRPAAASLAYRARRALRRSYLRGCIDAPVESDRCLAIRALLPPFVDGDTATPGAARVRSHIAVCPACDGVLAHLNSIHDRLSDRSWFVVSAAALRWMITDGGHALVAVIGTTPVVVAAGLGAGVLVSSSTNDALPERTEAAAGALVLDVEVTGDSDAGPHETVVRPTTTPRSPVGGTASATGPPTGGTSVTPSSPSNTIGVPTGAGGAEPEASVAIPAAPPIIGPIGQSAGGVEAIVAETVGTAVDGLTDTVDGLTGTDGATTSGVLATVEHTAEVVVAVQSNTLGVVQPVVASLPVVGQVSAPVVTVVDQIGEAELATVGATVEHLDATTGVVLDSVELLTDGITGILRSPS